MPNTQSKNHDVLNTGKFILDELDHFAQNFQQRPYYGDGEFVSKQHFEAVEACRAAEQELLNEPFVAYAAVSNRQEKGFFLICRHYPPSTLKAFHPGTEYASYLTPVGQLAAKHLGTQVRGWQLEEKAGFTPMLIGQKKWDAVNCLATLRTGSQLIGSIRKLLGLESTSDSEGGANEISPDSGDSSHVQGAAEDNNKPLHSLEVQAQYAVARTLRYKVELPAQAILDAVQDDIFRLPFDSFLRISGAPGTGKTTVLIKRLSQKTKQDFLTDDELSIVKKSGCSVENQWLFFSPSDLLKSYLKEALAKELLPASDDHVKVYSTLRLEILRDLGFIRVGKRGFFRIGFSYADSPAKSLSWRTFAALSRAFTDFLQQHHSSVVRNALNLYSENTDEAVLFLLNQAATIKAQSKKDLESIQNSNLNVKDRARKEDLAKEKGNDGEKLERLARNAESFSRLQIEKCLSMGTIFQYREGLLRLASELHGEAEKYKVVVDGYRTTILDIKDDLRKKGEIPDASLDLDKAHKVRELQQKQEEANETLSLVKLLDGLKIKAEEAAAMISLARLFDDIAPAYEEFRKTSAFEMEAGQCLLDNEASVSTLTEPELDILLLHALRFLHNLLGMSSSQALGLPKKLLKLKDRLRLIVMVDEATDFSPLELACMELFSVPKYGGVTICGDLMQRVTEQGLRAWDDMKDLCQDYTPKSLTTGYRQTATLFNIARELCHHSMGRISGFQSAYEIRDTDPPALAVMCESDKAVESWLVERICEIFVLSGDHLPTTAILVPTSEDVESMCKSLRPALMANGIEMEGSHEGQALGDTARVRVFPVEHIKGLEFEAVFYIGLDNMAIIHKDLLDKYVYVGLSRARSFLGVSYKSQFPSQLNCIKNLFEHGGSWG